MFACMSYQVTIRGVSYPQQESDGDRGAGEKKERTTEAEVVG